MNTFVVEHEYKGYPMFETITGVEDIDLTMFDKILTLWVCDNQEEVKAVENELRRKHAKNHEKECGK
jgi:hypothetical protein